jgi:hypothetical protein
MGIIYLIPMLGSLWLHSHKLNLEVEMKKYLPLIVSSVFAFAVVGCKPKQEEAGKTEEPKTETTPGTPAPSQSEGGETKAESTPTPGTPESKPGETGGTASSTPEEKKPEEKK